MGQVELVMITHFINDAIIYLTKKFKMNKKFQKDGSKRSKVYKKFQRKLFINPHILLFIPNITLFEIKHSLASKT
jgi:hypothetical protein